MCKLYHCPNFIFQKLMDFQVKEKFQKISPMSLNYSLRQGFFLDNLTIKIIFSNLGKPQEFFPAPNAIHKKNYLNVLPSLLLSITSVTVGFYK